MAITIRTVMTFPLDGSTVDFPITFDYLARKFVTITLLGTDRKALVLNQDYRFTAKNQITTTRAWSAADGYELIEIRRYTSATERLVDFQDGSILRATDLNVSQIQTLHVAEEARDLTADTIGVNNDGHLDARGRKLVNLADGTNAGDAVTVRQMQNWDSSALNSARKAKEEADMAKREADRAFAEAERAKGFAGNALASEQAAKVSEGKALASEQAAKVSETNSVTSAQKALVSEGNAKTSETKALASEKEALKQADRAEQEANKLGNMYTFAGNINTNYTVTGVSAINGILDVVNSDGGGGVGLFIPKEGVVSEDIRYRTGVWRPVGGSYGILESCFEKIGATGGATSRHDTYSYQWPDSNGWPDGRHLGFGRHTFLGATEFIARHGVITAIGEGGYSNYIMGKRSGVDAWYVGNGDAGNNVQLWNHNHQHGINLESDRVTINKNLYIGQATFGTDGSVHGSSWGGDLKTWIGANYLKGVRRGGETYVYAPIGSYPRAPTGCVLTGAALQNTGELIGVFYRPLQIGTGAGVWRNVWDA